MRTLKVYKSYNFVNKDPVLDIVRVIVEDSHKSQKGLSEESGVSTTTLYNWFKGRTRRPQFATICAVTRACGEEITVGGRRVTPRRRKTNRQGYANASYRQAS